MNWPKVLIGWAAVLCPAATSAQPAVSAVVPGTTSEPLVAVIVNERAYQTALTLAECMQAFKARHRSGTSEVNTRAQLGELESEECEIAKRQGQIVEQLRAANTTASEAEIMKEYQKTVMIALAEAFGQAAKRDRVSTR